MGTNDIIYSKEFEEDIIRWAQKRESRRRFEHTQRVVETVTLLARHWAPDAVTICRLAGWIHDAAKHYDNDKMLRKAYELSVTVRPYEFENPMLLHGAVAYAKAAEKFGIEDDQIRTACAFHTTGAPEMNVIDKLVFIADLVEPGRDFPTVGTLRAMAYVDIDKTMLLAVDNTLRYLLTRRRAIDPRVIDLYNVLIRAVSES